MAEDEAVAPGPGRRRRGGTGQVGAEGETVRADRQRLARGLAVSRPGTRTTAARPSAARRSGGHAHTLAYVRTRRRGPRRDPSEQRLLVWREQQFGYRGGPAPGPQAPGCLVGIHQVVQRPPSGQPPPRSQNVDYSAGPPPFFGSPIVPSTRRSGQAFRGPTAPPGDLAAAPGGPPPGRSGGVRPNGSAAGALEPGTPLP